MMNLGLFGRVPHMFRPVLARVKDPKWVHDLEELYPTPAKRQSMLNRRVVDGLRKEGDDLSKPRPVDHFLYFPDARSRQAFLSQASEMGFQLLGKLPEAKPRDLPFGLSIVREDFVHPPHCIDDVVAKLTNLAEQYEGEYDGWGCEIVMLQ